MEEKRALNDDQVTHISGGDKEDPDPNVGIRPTNPGNPIRFEGS